MTSEEKAATVDARVLEVSQEVSVLAAVAVEEINRASTIDELEKLRVTYLGKQSKITLLSKELGKVPPESRPAIGEAVNAGKKRLQEALSARKAAVDSGGRRSPSAIDVTLPGIRHGVGRRHPLMQTMEAVKDVLLGM
jgi:phenylalanyl-tRNA synthetase alpha chain